MTYMNVELACERMHEVDIGTYLKADAAQLFSEVPTCVCVAGLPKAAVEHARS